MLYEFVTWLNALPTVALRESRYVWPLLESARLMTLGLFAVRGASSVTP